MEISAATPHRQHALDNLRALMMWLGIVVHVAVNHMTGPMVLPWRDSTTSPIADLLAGVIHAFRMPVFLILAGYFVALLVERCGAGQMLRHRMRRIALPFVVFWPVIFALTVMLVMLYVHRAERGYFGLSSGIVPTVPHAPPINTLHLWFLYQLAGLVLLTFATLKLAPRLPQALRDHIATAFRALGERPWGFTVLALPLGLIGAQYSFGILTVTGCSMHSATSSTFTARASLLATPSGPPASAGLEPYYASYRSACSKRRGSMRKRPASPFAY